MKITALDVLTCQAGWRPWSFLKVSTDQGLVGVSDCTDSHGSNPAVAAVLKQFESQVVGRDPLHGEAIYWDLYRITRQSSGGVVHKALAALENALLDVKGQALGVPVHVLLGGPLREDIPLYWSHCGSTRVRSSDHIEAGPVQTLEDIAALGQEVRQRGFSGLKTNLLLLGGPEPRVLMQGFKGGPGSADRDLDQATLDQITALVAAFRDSAGPDADIILDVNMHFRADGNARLARALAPYGLAWLEVDTQTPDSLRKLSDQAPMPLGSLETLRGMREYLPYLQARGADVAIIDVHWNGAAQSKKIADLAETFEVNVAPHNHGSPLASVMTAHFCAAVSNLRLMEYDVDDVPWRDDIVSAPPVVKNGRMRVPDGPGWGTGLVEKEILARQP